jgi:hypothetical protein
VLRCGSLLSALVLLALAACASTSTNGGADTEVTGAGGGPGDVNCDRQVSPVDAALILQLDAGLIQRLACPQNADINGNGRTDAVDASLVLQYVAGLTDHLGGPASTATPTRTRTPTPAATAVATPVTCGVERWPVKTLSDSDAALVDFTPVTSTVAELRAIPAPPSLPQNSRIAPTELTTYTVTANLVEFKLEDDRDIHLVIADQTDASQTMIVEFPNASVCAGAVDSAHAAEMRTARAALVAAVGQPSSSHFTNLTGTGTITGVGFFDFQHGQTGVAPNGIELHPVLAFSTTQSGPTATPVLATPTPPVGNCDPSYPTVCIPPPPPDLDCGDITYRNFTVLPPDPHRFDGDHDGIGCET